MMIYSDPDEYEVVVQRRVCPFHQLEPDSVHPGCTCSAGYSHKRRSPDEIAAIKSQKRREEEDRILAAADAIRARRAALKETDNA